MPVDAKTQELERLWAGELADHNLSDTDYNLWNSLQVAHRVGAYRTKTLIIWDAPDKGNPRIVDIVKIFDVRATFDSGLAFQFENKEGDSVWIGHNPTRLFDHELFLWVPYYCDLKWVPLKGTNKRIMRASVVMKMRGHPSYVKPNHTFISEVKPFTTQWPEYANQTF